MAYQVGIDLGTTSTVAAVCHADGTARVVPLEGPTGAVVSAVHLGVDGALLVGEAAARRALSDPGRVVRDLTRRIGDDTPLLVGHEPVPAGEPAARFLARLVDDVARREGGVASRVAVTHPGSWGPHRIGALRAALAAQGLGSAVLVPEPVAAARTVPDRVGRGLVAVYDLGGGRFEASVVRGAAAGLVLAGAPEEIERLGGADLDELVFGHVRTALGAGWESLDPADAEVLAAVADLRRECTAAKEALSRDTEVLVPVALPGLRTQVRLGRAEFEDMIRPVVAETVEAMRRALDAAGTTPAELAALLLVGGSAQVPLVPQLLGEAFGRAVTVPVDPVGTTATGAALLIGGPAGRTGTGARRSGSVRPDPPPGRPSAATSGRAVPGPGRTAPPALAGPAAAGGRVAADGPAAVRAAADGPAAGLAAAGGAAAGGAAAGRAAAGGSTAGVGGAAADPAVPSDDADAPPGDTTADDAPYGGTRVLPVARPPKQARPFTAVPATSPSRPGRIVLVASAAALALAVLGGVVAFGVGRIGAGQEADAVTPASVVEPSAPATTTAAPAAPAAPTVQPAPPGRPAVPPPARRTRPAPPPPPAAGTPSAATTASTTSAPDAGQDVTTAPPPETEEPAAGGGNDQDAGGDGAGGGTDDAAEGQDAGGNAEPTDPPAAVGGGAAPPAGAAAAPGAGEPGDQRGAADSPRAG